MLYFNFNLQKVTNESSEMCKVWSVHTSTASQKIQSLRKACEKHVSRMNEAKNGRGVDRHLFGLKNLALQKRQRYLKFFKFLLLTLYFFFTIELWDMIFLNFLNILATLN